MSGWLRARCLIENLESPDMPHAFILKMRHTVHNGEQGALCSMRRIEDVLTRSKGQGVFMSTRLASIFTCTGG